MAEMYEQNGLRDRAFAKYDQVARQENIQPSFRWHARLCKIRLAVLHDVEEEPNKANAYKSLCEMIQQATGDQRIDALELLGNARIILINKSHLCGLISLFFFRKQVSAANSVSAHQRT